MKTDHQLQDDVREELRSDARVCSTDVAVTVVDGVVALTGVVPDFAQRVSAVRAAERVAGVRGVSDNLLVHLPPEFLRSDADLAHAVTCTLAWNTEVPDRTIKPRVQDRWLWLVGEADFHYQRAAAEQAVENIVGVHGVTNIVRIKRHAPAPDLKTRIEQALRRDSTLQARSISVVVDGASVALAGSVRSWRERRAAAEAAWSALGVRSVDNHLEVDTLNDNPGRGS